MVTVIGLYWRMCLIFLTDKEKLLDLLTDKEKLLDLSNRYREEREEEETAKHKKYLYICILCPKSECDQHISSHVIWLTLFLYWNRERGSQ